MATAKQIAWRKKFAALAKSGAFKKSGASKKSVKKSTSTEDLITSVSSGANPKTRRRSLIVKAGRKVYYLTGQDTGGKMPRVGDAVSKWIPEHMLARKSNPAKKSSYVTRPSQITRRTPTKRLKARRAKNVASGVTGYFPNPKQKTTGYVVRYAATRRFVANFGSKSEAVEYANALAAKTGKQIAIEFA